MDNTTSHTTHSRWLAARACGLLVVLFLLAHYFLAHSDFAATALNDLSWSFISLIASLSCWMTARQLSGHERVAWLLIGAGCFSWFAGQAVWNVHELVFGQLPAFPHWMQILFVVYAWLIVGGLLALPKPQGTVGFSLRHGANLALIVCALMATFVIALLEPALQPQRNPASNIVAVFHCTALAAMFITALYLLWSYRWRALYWPIALIVLGAGIHTATYIAYLHQMMTVTYHANSWFNVSWLFVFGAFTCAAAERRWQIHSPRVVDTSTLLPRDLWLGAWVPASLIVIMLSITWFYSEWLTRRTVSYAMTLGLIFAAILGVREVWIQRQERHLLEVLHRTNAEVLQANRELTQSELRYKSLSTELEQRVADRTTALQQAYRELENFSYAVAHDLKAPLRAVSGFGSLLAQEYGERLDDKGRNYVDRMRRSVLTMDQLIDDLLAYARVERREFELRPISLTELIDSVLAEQRDELEKAGTLLKKNMQPVDVEADLDGLRIVIRNLLQNALKFSRQARPPTIRIDAQVSEHEVHLAIADNGIGFDMTYHDRIFEMFQRLHRADEIPGTGIGLAIVRKAMERMGGRVWATASPGSGATFHLQLPTAKRVSV